MRILVTGSAGFMGSHLAKELRKAGHTVYGLDNLSTGYAHNIEKGTKQNFFRCDLRRRDTTDFVMRIARPDMVFHLAAWAHEGLSQFCPNRIIENNINASMNLLVSSIRAGVKKFVFTSSMSIYGDQKPPFHEDLPRKPVDIYGHTKATFEGMLEVMSKVYDFEYTIIRPHNVYGPGQSLGDPYRNVVGIFMNRILQGKDLHVYGDGNQKRAFSYIDDVTRAIIESGFRNTAGEIFNIGPTKEYTINQLVKYLEEIVQETIPDYPGLSVRNLPDRPVEVKDAWCTNEKAINLLDYKDTVSFKEGLRRMWAWSQGMGPQEQRYLDRLELVTHDTPENWLDKS